MNKTMVEQVLPCGCVVLVWAFGREYIQHCPDHPYKHVVYSWPSKSGEADRAG